MAMVWPFDRQTSELNARAAANVLKQAAGIWQGEAADRFQSGTSPVGNWVDEAHQITTAAASLLEDQAGHYSTAKNTMPPPVPVPPVNQAANSSWVAFVAQQRDLEPQERAATAASDHARAIYTTYTDNSNDTAGNAASRYSQAPTRLNLAAGTVTPQATPAAGSPVSSVSAHMPSALAKPPTPPTRTSAGGQHVPAAPVVPGASGLGLPANAGTPLLSGMTTQQAAPTMSPGTVPTVGQPESTGAGPKAGPVGGIPGFSGMVGGETPLRGGSSSGGRLAGGAPNEVGSDIMRRLAGGKSEPAPGNGARSGVGAPGSVAEEPVKALGANGAAAERSAMAGGPMGAGGRKEEDAEHQRKYVQATDEHFGANEIPSTVVRAIGEEDEL